MANYHHFLPFDLSVIYQNSYLYVILLLYHVGCEAYGVTEMKRFRAITSV
jgi:hypothetical protein